MPSLFQQIYCGRDEEDFFRFFSLTSGIGAGLASRILSAVQYLRVSSGEVSTECFVIAGEDVDFARRFLAKRNTPISKLRRMVLIKDG
jgi:hypothetical protein